MRVISDWLCFPPTLHSDISFHSPLHRDPAARLRLHASSLQPHVSLPHTFRPSGLGMRVYKNHSEASSMPNSKPLNPSYPTTQNLSSGIDKQALPGHLSPTSAEAGLPHLTAHQQSFPSGFRRIIPSQDPQLLARIARLYCWNNSLLRHLNPHTITRNVHIILRDLNNNTE